MSKDNIITGLDIGSTTIRIVVAQINPDGRIHIIGGAEGPSEGVNKGVVTSIEDAVSSISACLERAERMTGLAIEHAYVGISGCDITSQESRGVIAVAKADGEIKEDEVERALEAAQTVATPPNYEIIHVLPHLFNVDTQKNIKDPVGMTGVRLEAETQIIEGPSSQIKNLTKCIYRTGVDIDDLVFSILATAEAVLNRRQKELGVAVVNIGGSTTSVAVFEEGDTLTTHVLPIGANHITADLAIGLRTSIEVAEQIKLEYGTAITPNLKAREEINLAEISGGEDGVVTKKHLAEIIGARVEEIFTMADEKLKDIDRSGKLPSGVILTGGGAKLDGIAEVAKKVFRLPASLGYPTGVVSAIDKMNDLSFSTAIGLVLWGKQMRETIGGRGSFSPFSFVSKLAGSVARWFKGLRV
ncbi:cell division protein FtsA [Patescibacteria group bacterium]|nr:cell division protein FtsA [Patescibacteria group bacterium]MBU4511835.1 cell division protein FtsA [Patescibacteria group bacterium]MCG2693434.1 cell division protein FtsA [Candidatus Parcubacteria bacterium]